jgi:hypothetical protein
VCVCMYLCVHEKEPTLVSLSHTHTYIYTTHDTRHSLNSLTTLTKLEALLNRYPDSLDVVSIISPKYDAEAGRKEGVESAVQRVEVRGFCGSMCVLYVCGCVHMYDVCVLMHSDGEKDGSRSCLAQHAIGPAPHASHTHTYTHLFSIPPPLRLHTQTPPPPPTTARHRPPPHSPPLFILTSTHTYIQTPPPPTTTTARHRPPPQATRGVGHIPLHLERQGPRTVAQCRHFCPRRRRTNPLLWYDSICVCGSSIQTNPYPPPNDKHTAPPLSPTQHPTTPQTALGERPAASPLIARAVAATLEVLKGEEAADEREEGRIDHPPVEEGERTCVVCFVLCMGVCMLIAEGRFD